MSPTDLHDLALVFGMLIVILFVVVLWRYRF